MKPNQQWALAVNRIKLTGLALTAGVMLTQPLMAAGPAPIDLLSCSNFTILAGATVTSTGGGIINGDIGMSPANSLVGFPPATCNGTIYNGGSIAAQAQVDLTAAFNAASPAQLPGGIDVGAELGGLALVAGVYKSPSGAYDITLTDLTLTGGANDVWVFQMASTLTVGVGRKVILTGGAQAKNIFWQVGSAATLMTSSIFKGTIMSYAAITMNASSTMDGRALSQTAAVTFNGSSGSLPTKMSQVITNFIPTNGSVFAGTNIVGLSAQASSTLPVSFTRISGPGTIIGSTNLYFANTGLVRIVASQTGDVSYFAAPSVTNTFTVIPPLSALPGWLQIQMTPASGSWQLTAPTGYTGPTTGTGSLAAVSAVLGEYGIAYGALSGYMAPTNQTQVVIAGVTSLFVGVYLPVSTNIAPPVVTATKGVYFDRVKLSWQSVTGVTGYEIWKSQTNDVNTAILVVEIPDYGTEIFQYDDLDVVPIRSYYYWGLSTMATQASPMSITSMGYAARRAINDYDGDGKSDLAVYRDGYWYIGSLANGNILLNGNWGGPGWTPVTGDYDGDGKADLAVYSDGYWYIGSLANGNILLNGNWGGPGWTPVPGDYDGDGKADLAVYNDGYWYIYSLANGSILLDGNWGGSGWSPVPGDYDGDGKADLSVYGYGYWYIYSLANGSILENGNWGVPDWTPVR